jgi:hypothetical protein
MFVSCFMVKAFGWSWFWLVLVEQAARSQGSAAAIAWGV